LNLYFSSIKIIKKYNILFELNYKPSIKYLKLFLNLNISTFTHKFLVKSLDSTSIV